MYNVYAYIDMYMICVWFDCLYIYIYIYTYAYIYICKW